MRVGFQFNLAMFLGFKENLNYIVYNVRQEREKLAGLSW